MTKEEFQGLLVDIAKEELEPLAAMLVFGELTEFKLEPLGSCPCEVKLSPIEPVIAEPIAITYSTDISKFLQ